MAARVSPDKRWVRSTAVNINASDSRHNEFLACLKEVRDNKELGGDGLELKRDLGVCEGVGYTQSPRATDPGWVPARGYMGPTDSQI